MIWYSIDWVFGYLIILLFVGYLLRFWQHTATNHNPLPFFRSKKPCLAYLSDKRNDIWLIWEKKDWQGLDYRHCDIPLPMTYPWDRNIYQAISPCSCGHFSYHALGDNPYMEHLRYLSIGFIFGNLCQTDFSNKKQTRQAFCWRRFLALFLPAIWASQIWIYVVKSCHFMSTQTTFPKNAPGCLTSHAPWLPYPKTWRPFAVRSSFLPRLGNVAGLAQLRPELEILTAKIPKKNFPNVGFEIFHQIITTWTAWIFPGI